jgi:hypothetical protein
VLCQTRGGTKALPCIGDSPEVRLDMQNLLAKLLAFFFCTEIELTRRNRAAAHTASAAAN